MARGLAPEGILVLWAKGDPENGGIAPQDLAIGSGESGGPFTQLASGGGMILPPLGESPLPLRFTPTWRYRPGHYEARLTLVPESGGDGIPYIFEAEVPPFLQCRSTGVQADEDGSVATIFQVTTNGELWEVRLNEKGVSRPPAGWELVSRPREVSVVSQQKGLIMGRGPVEDLELVVRIPGERGKTSDPVQANGRVRP